VHLDGCIEVEAAYYGEPPGWIGRRVQVQWNARQVRLINPETGQLLREHLRQARGGHRIKEEDRPKKTPLGILQLLDRAGKAGSQIEALCRGITKRRARPPCAAFSACCRWPRSMVPPAWTMPAPPPWKSAFAIIALSAAT